jgi:hypothetical protein
MHASDRLQWLRLFLAAMCGFSSNTVYYCMHTLCNRVTRESSVLLRGIVFIKFLRINIDGEIQTACVPCFGYTWMYDFVLKVRCVRMMIKSDAIRKEMKGKSSL